MISKSISLSQQVDSLSIQGQLLFTWLVPHSDDEGRISGNPRYVKAVVIPLKDGPRWAVSSVELYLCEMADNNLISYWYQGGERFIEFPNWSLHQTIQSDRAQLSRLPAFNKDKAKDAKDFPSITIGDKMDTESIRDEIGMDIQYKLSKVNIREFNMKEKKLAGIIKLAQKDSLHKITDPRINKLKNYFVSKVKEKKNFEPDISPSKDGWMLKLRLGKYSEEQIKSLIDGFVQSTDSDKLSCSLSVCLSNVIVNKWLGGQLTKRPSVTKI